MSQLCSVKNYIIIIIITPITIIPPFYGFLAPNLHWSLTIIPPAGFRDKSRKIVIYASDAGIHIAGDG